MRIPFLMAVFTIATTSAFASNVPDIDVCGKVIPDGTNWMGERLKRVLEVRGRKMGVNEFVNKYCQGEEGTKSETCTRANRISSIDMAAVRRTLPKGLCKQ